MKRYILLSLMSLLAALQLSAQIIIKSNSDTITVGNENPVTKISFQNTYPTISDSIVFTLQNGESFMLDFSELDKIFFAKDAATGIHKLKADEVAVVYDANQEKVWVANAKPVSVLTLFNMEGKHIRTTKGSSMSLSGVKPGLYIVNYNGTLNVKILKQ